MMNLTLLAAQTAIGDTLAGGNPVLTPVSGEAQMDLWVSIFSLNDWRLSAKPAKTIPCLWSVSVTISAPAK